MQYPPNQHNWATDSVCCIVKEGLYGSRVQHTACVVAVSRQLGTVVYPDILTKIRMHHVSQP